MIGQWVSKLTRKDKYALFGLTAIAICTHFPWLFVYEIFTSGDWWYIGQEQYKNFSNFSPIWVSSGFGTTSATPSFYFIRFMEGLLSLVGSNFILNEKLFFFIPVTFAGILGSYLFLKQYFKEWPSFVGAIAFSFNTALLFNYAGPLTIATVGALTPLAMLLFRQYIINYKNKTYLLLAALMFSIMACYELRITLLAGGLAFGLFIFQALSAHDKIDYVKKRLLPLSYFVVIVLLLHLFWLLPYVVGARSGVTFSNSLSQGLFVSFSNIENALALSHPFWTGERPATFVVQAVEIVAWGVPLVAFSGFLIARGKIHKEIMYWSTISLIGLFLVKQVNEPFDNVYPWLFDHIPGFAAFREASKFYLFVAMGYSVLIAFTVTQLRNLVVTNSKAVAVHINFYKYFYAVTSCLILGLFLINAKPLVTGEFRTLYIPREMPRDYVVFNKYIAEQKESFRILWVPSNSRWGEQSDRHPSIGATNITEGFWLNGLTTKNLTSSATLRDRSLNIFAHQSSGDMLNSANIKYVVVPTRDVANEDDFFKSYGDDRQYYINRLDTLNYLKKLNLNTDSLVVYENTDYNPRVHASTVLHAIDTSPSASTEPVHSFVTSTLKQEFNFVSNAPETSSSPPKQNVVNVFENLAPENIKNEGVSKTVASMDRPVLYANTNSYDIRYEIKNNELTFYSKLRNKILLNGKRLMSTSNEDEKAIYTQKVSGEKEYYIQKSDSIHKLNTKSDISYLGVLNEPVKVFEVVGDNLIANATFEEKLWQKHVEDCNGYDNKPIINMAKSSLIKKDGKFSLELSASRHSACTTSESVKNVSDYYLLQLDHLTQKGQRASYEVSFNDEKRTVVRKEFISGGRWRTHSSVIASPKGATSFTIRLVRSADYRLQYNVISNFDNIQMRPVAMSRPIPQSTELKYEKIDLPANQMNVITYEGSGYNASNLIKNGSFNSGLWQQKVSDCNSFDDKPQIGMKLVKYGAGSALELSARRHAACTSNTNIAVNENKYYLLNFKYQSPNAKQASYTVQFDDPNSSSLQGYLPVKNDSWQQFGEQIQAPVGATNMSITVYAQGGDSGAVNIINRYAEFSLKEIPTAPNQYFVVNASEQKLEKPKSIDYKIVNPSKKTIVISQASTPFYLTISDKYNPLWKLQLDDSKANGYLNSWVPWAKTNSVPEQNHYVAQDYINGWYINPNAVCSTSSTACSKNSDGTYNLKLTAEYAPQRYFYFGAIVSGTVLVSMLVYLGGAFIGSRKATVSSYARKSPRTGLKIKRK